MAIIATKFKGPISPQQRIDISDGTGYSPVAMVNEKGELILETRTNKISVDDLIRRLEALETAYMELLMTGKASDNGDTSSK